jgi:esterase
VADSPSRPETDATRRRRYTPDVTSSTRVLHVTRVGAEGQASRWLAMLHGLYGRGRNWQAIARELAAQRPDWGALLVDLRLHGESLGFEPPHTLEAAAEDVRNTLAGLAPAPAGSSSAAAADKAAAAGSVALGGVLGHSFGGKVALALAAQRAAQVGADADSMFQVWVIDSTPETRAPSGSAWEMLQHVRAMPETFTARADAIAALQQRGWNTGVATWMATNLRFVDGRFRWTLDFDGMDALLRSFFATDLWHVVEQPPSGVEIHFVKAEESHTLSEDACARIQRAGAAHGRVHLHRLAGGHWLNTDNPQGIISLLVQHLPAPGARRAPGA